MGFKFNALTGKFDLVNDGGTGSSTFIGLSDVDETTFDEKKYSFVTVNETADGLEFSENLFLPKFKEATSEFPQVSSKVLIFENAYWYAPESEERTNKIALRYVNDGLFNWLSFYNLSEGFSEFLLLVNNQTSFGLYSRQVDENNPIKLGNISLIESNVKVFEYDNGVGEDETNILFLTAFGDFWTAGRTLGSSTTIASANDLVLGNANQFIVSGTTQINAISALGWTEGSRITLIFEDVLTVKHNTSGGANTAKIQLVSGNDLNTIPNTVLFLEYDGTNWVQLNGISSGTVTDIPVTIDDDYTLQVTDTIIFVDTSLNDVLITIPSAQFYNGRKFTIKDLGNAQANNISIVGETGELIETLSTFVLDSNRESKTFVCDGTNMWVI